MSTFSSDDRPENDSLVLQVSPITVSRKGGVMTHECGVLSESAVEKDGRGERCHALLAEETMGRYDGLYEQSWKWKRGRACW